MTTIFFDEAGYTGDRLSDQEQPAFTLASHQLTNAEASALLRDAYPRSRAQEIKHTAVRKTEDGRAGTVALVRALRQRGAPIAVFAVHKRFALFQRLFDWLVEPVMKDTGFSAYDGAFNIAFTNVAYLTLPPLLEPNGREKLLFYFERAVRERSRDLLLKAWSILRSARDRQNEGGTRMMLDILLAGELAGFEYFDRLPAGALDVSLSTLVALMAHWRRKSPGPFDVAHDETSALTGHRPIWEWLTSPDQQEQTLGFGDFRDVPLPLNVTATHFLRSQDHAGIQLADVLAGAHYEICRTVMGASQTPEYGERLLEAGLGEVANNIWPDLDWTAPDTVGDPEAVDPLDFIANGPLRRAARGGTEPPPVG